MHVSLTYAPDRNVHGANMGPIWGREDPGGPHVGPMNFAIWGVILERQQPAIFLMITRLFSNIKLGIYQWPLLIIDIWYSVNEFIDGKVITLK